MYEPKQVHIFLIGADKEDIVQEGMIGLYKAIRDFKGTSFLLLRHLLSYVLRDKLLPQLKQPLDKNIFRLIRIFLWTSLFMMKNRTERLWMSFQERKC